MEWYDDYDIEIDIGCGTHRKKLKDRRRNAASWRMFFEILVKKALDRYDFENLPPTVNERVLKLSLLWHASVCFFEKDGELMALPGAAGSHGVTVYGDYTHCYVYGRNGYNEEIPLWLPGEEELPFLSDPYLNTAPTIEQPRGVWIRENINKYPFIDIAFQYADQLADTWRKIEVARKNAAVPLVIITDENAMPSVKKAIERRDNNEEMLLLSSGMLDATRIQVEPIQTSADAVKVMTDLIEWYFNQFDALCGKNSNANPDKKERLLVDEVNANNETTQNNIDDLIRYLQQGLDEVNKHFGTDIRVQKPVTEGDENNDALRGMDKDTDGQGAMGDS